MFSNLKKKLNNAIHEGLVITESLQQQYRQRVNSKSSSPLEASLASNRSSLSNLSTIEYGIPSDVNIAAGCNLLAKYEDDWKAIHENNENNDETATRIATRIELIEKKTTSQHTNMNDLVTCLSGIPDIIKNLNNSLKRMEEVTALSVATENKLIELENLCEECDFQQYMLKKQFELSQYKKKKMVELESYRQKVAHEHQNKIHQHEENLLRIQRERQAVFDDAFREDVAEYKQRGVLPVMQKDNTVSRSVVLEEVVFDDANETKDALEEFLNG